MAHRSIPIAVVLLAAVAPSQDLGSALERFVTDEALEGARVGVLVRDLATGEDLVAHDADHGFMTASNMKLVSSSVALVTLGPDFRYETRLVATGPITDGVLEGDLVLVGSGDPTFGGRQEEHATAVLERMVGEAVERHGLKRVTGRVLGDDDCQPDERLGDGWSWNYLGADYAAPASGLCFAENCITVVATPTFAGEAPDVSTEPATGYFDVENRARCIADGERRAVWADRRIASEHIVVGGRLPVDASAWRDKLSVENPTAFAAQALRDVLVARGVEIEGAALDRDEIEDRPEAHGDAHVLAVHRSAPLGEILHVLNKVSQNLYAEQVIRTASRVAAGDASMRSATAHAKEVLRGLGVDPRGMKVADGSGLTRLNLVRPRQLADLLTGMWRHQHKELFVDTLPIAGVDGTLRSRMKETPAQGLVRAKTGYIGSVVALSGYVPREEGEPLVFSILVNNFTSRTSNVKDAVDRFVVALCDRARR